jgi:hypothetical protein
MVGGGGICCKAVRGCGVGYLEQTERTCKILATKGKCVAALR